MNQGQNPSSSRIPLRVEGRVRMFAASDILWIEAHGHSAILHLRDGSRVEVRPGIGAIARETPTALFMSINRSEIVNLEEVAGTEHKSNGDHVLSLRDGTQLILSRTRRAEVLRRLMGGT
jgi:two-component system LytT family response regulator